VSSERRIELRATVAAVGVGPWGIAEPVLVVNLPATPDGADYAFAEGLRRLANEVQGGSKWADLIEAIEAL
jgi:hypothetical protein